MHFRGARAIHGAGSHVTLAALCARWRKGRGLLPLTLSLTVDLPPAGLAGLFVNAYCVGIASLFALLGWLFVTAFKACLICPFSIALDAGVLCLWAPRLVFRTARLAFRCRAAAGEWLAAQPAWRLLERRLEDGLAAALTWGSSYWVRVAALAHGLLQGTADLNMLRCAVLRCADVASWPAASAAAGSAQACGNRL